jgi:hypothetical protein
LGGESCYGVEDGRYWVCFERCHGRLCGGWVVDIFRVVKLCSLVLAAAVLQAGLLQIDVLLHVFALHVGSLKVGNFSVFKHRSLVLVAGMFYVDMLRLGLIYA